MLPDRGRRDITFIREGLRPSHGTEWPVAALWIVATRLRDGHRVVFGRLGAPETDVGSAVAASCEAAGETWNMM